MPSAAPATDAPSNSGITTSSTGEQHIPSSTRPDGSVRKEIRVRPGYRPPEDVELYKNRTAEAWRTRGKGGVPGADFVSATSTAKGKEQKKKTKPMAGSKAIVLSDDLTTKDKASESEESRIAQAAEEVDLEAEKDKQAKKLSKKLRQAKDLQKKREEGDSLLPEQLEKVIKMNEIIRQLDTLGFDADGQKKA